jgi:hypothetical protein
MPKQHSVLGANALGGGGGLGTDTLQENSILSMRLLFRMSSACRFSLGVGLDAESPLAA